MSTPTPLHPKHVTETCSIEVSGQRITIALTLTPPSEPAHDEHMLGPPPARPRVERCAITHLHPDGSTSALSLDDTGTLLLRAMLARIFSSEFGGPHDEVITTGANGAMRKPRGRR